jgi:energy-coupling factor transporter ATP-binding protein EcfA2
VIKQFAIEKSFAAVPYLPTSQLMKRFPKGIKFATDKVNVIVGDNGAGKSALMRTLSLLTLSNLSGVSAFDDNIYADGDSKPYWTCESRWSDKYEYLKGLVCDHDFAPALYYRPGHLPGNEAWINQCFFTGYGAQAKEHLEKTDKRSSGQQCHALLEKLYAVLKGEQTLAKYAHINWRHGKEMKKPDHRSTEYDHKGYLLKQTYGTIQEGAVPLILMDEPEQSLSARAEIELWKLIESADLTRMQVIVATHSFYPMLHPERFNIIEAEEGYIDNFRSMLGHVLPA